MKSISESIKESYTVNENNEMTGEEYVAYWDGVADAIEDLKFPQLKKYYSFGMPKLSRNMQKLVMLGVSILAAWIRGCAESDADDDPEGYDYYATVPDILYSRDPADYSEIIENCNNNDDYEDLVYKISEDEGDGEMVRWFETDFLMEFTQGFLKKYK